MVAFDSTLWQTCGLVQTSPILQEAVPTMKDENEFDAALKRQDVRKSSHALLASVTLGAAVGLWMWFSGVPFWVCGTVFGFIVLVGAGVSR